MERESAMNLKLFDNVQFIYELVLAEMELAALELDFSVNDNLRSFQCLSTCDSDALRKRLAYFDYVDGLATDYSSIVKRNITRSPNQYLTHWIYPYKGKYHPQMIRALLNVIGAQPGEVILDPFVGSGTTLLECQLLGIDSIGIDVSHVCTLISKVKTQSMDVLEELEDVKEEVLNACRSTTLFTFDESQEKQKGDLGQTLNNIEDERVRNFYKAAELIAHSDKSRRKKKDFYGSFQTNVEKMLTSTRDYSELVEELKLPLGKVRIDAGDARNLDLKNESIDGIITSPPYSIALDYVKNDAHALSALGYDLEKVRDDFIGVRGTGTRKVELYNRDIR
ncbi:MAG: hypothetical protein JSW28_04875 [Thermoplasmata archaeon]|nr:MAG: hypothetical protein JSW28_04875 [Thermoplasmata archaeon]